MFAYVDIVSLSTLKLEGTTDDGHHSPAGLHSHSPLDVVISRVVCRIGFRVFKAIFFASLSQASMNSHSDGSLSERNPLYSKLDILERAVTVVRATQMSRIPCSSESTSLIPRPFTQVLRRSDVVKGVLHHPTARNWPGTGTSWTRLDSRIRT
ncbi:hypothetical protein BJY52DRAFT_1313073, partial [Lactarius psammicola]